jgi:hypothetical protein
LRLETDAKCDKKKSELYFVSLVKKILTEILGRVVDFRERISRRATLTEAPPSRIIFPSTQEHVPSSAF